MKDEKEINVSENCAIGNSLGWTTDGQGFFYDKNHKMHACMPNWFRDANTRPEMLASLTEEEKRDLIWNYWEDYREKKGLSNELSVQYRWMPFCVLELDQPTFARIFCKVKGLL